MKKFLSFIICILMVLSLAGTATAEEYGIVDITTDFNQLGSEWALARSYHIRSDGKLDLAVGTDGKLEWGTLHYNEMIQDYELSATVDIEGIDKQVWQSAFFGSRITTKGAIWDNGLWIGVREDNRIDVRVNGTNNEVAIPFSFENERTAKLVDDGKDIKFYGVEKGKEVLLTRVVSDDGKTVIYDGKGKAVTTVESALAPFGYVGFMSHFKETVFSEVSLRAKGPIDKSEMHKVIAPLVGYQSVPAVGGTAVNKIFKDIDHVSWAFEGIAALNARGVVSGTAPGVFDPDGTLTKEQYIKLVAGGFELMDATAETSFSDVAKGEWYYSYVASAEKAGLLDGIYSGTLGVGEPISREDMVTIALRALKAKNVSLFYKNEAINFEDSASIAPYAKEAVTELCRAGIVNGVTETTFEPKGTATRAAAAKVLCGLLNYIPNTNIRDTMPDTWVGYDNIDRKLYTTEDVGERQKEKYVGMFFYIWHENSVKEVYDNMKIKAISLGEDRPWGPENAYHYCQEPYFGYYRNSDEFVIRKNIQMLSDAGVDFLYLDTTNAQIYPQVLSNMFKVMREMQNEGKRVPKFCFTFNTNAESTLENAYNQIYSKRIYEDLWFMWEGKPLVLCPLDQVPDYLQDFFTVRHSWAYGFGDWWNLDGEGYKKWPWLAAYPQPYGWSKAPTIPEQLVCATAQHPTDNIGKSFHNGAQPAERRTEEGLYFAEQISRIKEVKPQVVMFTQWNEKIAMRFANRGNMGRRGDEEAVLNGSYFVDAYDDEYNRDIEPVKGTYGDNYYYQMVNGARIQKGVRKAPETDKKQTMTIGKDFGAWQTVSEVYYDDSYDIPHRNSTAVGNTVIPYVETSGRNDIVESRVARDDSKVYFYVKTQDEITVPEASDKSHMILMLNTDGNYDTGWYGYDYIIGRARNGEYLSVEKCTASDTWQWKVVARATYTQAGNEKHLEINKADLGIEGDKFVIDFKWTDNVPDNPDIMQFIDKGDAAPNGRFNYRFTAK